MALGFVGGIYLCICFYPFFLLESCEVIGRGTVILHPKLSLMLLQLYLFCNETSKKRKKKKTVSGRETLRWL